MPADLFVPGPGGGLSDEWVYDRVNATTYIPLYRNFPSSGGPVAAPTAAAVATSTGVNPTETSYSLYGHIIPLSYGSPRIGGEIIAGPWVSGGLASFCISFGVPFDPSDTRTLTEIAFDSQVVWTGSLVGAGTPNSSGFTTEPITCRFYDGKLTQAADALEISHFGANAVAYRPQILIWFENLPLAGTKFGKIPYVSARFVDSTGGDVNFGTAFETLAYSPWVGLTSAQFETVGITDVVTNGGLVFASDAEFLATIQQFGRFYRSWDIIQTDKLRIIDRGSTVAPDIVLDKSRLTGQLTIARASTDSVPRELVLSTIDPDADYTIVPSKASFPRDPVNVSTSVKVESQYLPVIMDSATRISIVTYTKYSEEIARKKIACTAMFYGIQIEPGALLGLSSLATGIADETFKVKETTHGANYTVEILAESFMDCGIPTLSCAAATAFLARTSGLDGTHITAYSNLICGLVADGVWSLLDALYIYATQDSTTALLNLVSSSYNSASHGSPTFTADRGFTGVTGSSTVYIDTTFDFNAAVSPKFTAPGSAHISGWSVVDVGAEAHAMMGEIDSFGRLMWLHPKYVDNNSYYRILSQAVGSVANATPTGHYLANRSGSSASQGYKNGSLVMSDATLGFVTPLAGNNKMYTLGVNNQGTALGSPHQMAMASIGGSLDATQTTNFYNRLRTYMTAVGVP